MKKKEGKRKWREEKGRKKREDKKIDKEDKIIDWIEGIEWIKEEVGKSIRKKVKRYGGLENGRKKKKRKE